MKRISFIAIGTVALLCIIAISAPSALAKGRLTHLGVTPDDMVLLHLTEKVLGGGSAFFYRHVLGEPISTVPFEVPKGMVFIPTDISVFVSETGVSIDGGSIEATDLYRIWEFRYRDAYRIHERSFTGGFVIPAGATFKIKTYGSIGATEDAFILGYLVKTRK